jgi:uncharacterized protein involved in high-affinity Fe2+ transport
MYRVLIYLRRKQPKELAMKRTLSLILWLALVAQVLAQGAAPKVKTLSIPEDPTKKTVLVGRAVAAGMVIMFEIEPAKAMWMPVGKQSQWMEHAPRVGEKFHVEVKPIDPKSNTRISFAKVLFQAVNKDTGKKVAGELLPMWGGSGLHYTMNSALAGNGTYEAQVTVGVPSFGRAPSDKEMWTKPATASFHFKLKDDQLVEVTEPEL